MSEDKFVDVFPINIDYAKGEQPAAAKLTAQSKQTDTAFTKLTRAIGDPQDYFSHSGADGTYLLSPEKLAQTSLARIIGPSDYLSPRGASFQDPIQTACAVSLAAYRNQWNLGFPLVKLTTPIDLSDALETRLGVLEWGVDITATAACLTTLKDTLEEVTEAGDFYVDFLAGVITSYSVPTTTITVTINSINMLGPGVPWASHNVIPNWKQTTELCYVTGTPNGTGTTTYTVTLPTVEATTRDTVNLDLLFLDKLDDTHGASSTWSISSSGQSAYYRLPYQIVNNLTSGDEIPTGYILIYDNLQGRILTVTGIYYVDEHTLTVTAPDGWLTLGNSVRIICSGSSIAENIQWLNSAFRDNQHSGLSRGSKSDTAFFSVPISHDVLRDLYTDRIPSTITDKTKFYFRASSFPTNPHPQYLHRSGYQTNDLDGNHANSMIGDITFAGISPDYALGVSSNSGNMSETYGITWGSNASTSTRLAYEGGHGIDSWVSGVALRRGFNITGTGAVPSASDINYGALTYTPWNGTPLYLRGSNLTTENCGSLLGFDYGRYGEMNYVKLMCGVRVGSYDVANVPVEYLQDDFDTPLLPTPALTKRLTALQTREFRFRGVSYNPYALNANNSLGATVNGFDTALSFAVVAKYQTHFLLSITTNASFFRVGQAVTLSGFAYNNSATLVISDLDYYTSAGPDGTTYLRINVTGTPLNQEISPPSGARITVEANEFNSYFTSPGIVGADFLNVYSNVIFFSDTGDGKATSFTTNGTNWMKAGTNAPTGLYYLPSGISESETNSCFAYSLYNLATETSTYPFSFGDAYGFRYASASGGRIQLWTNDDGHFGLWQGATAVTAGTAAINTNNTIYAVDSIYACSPFISLLAATSFDNPSDILSYITLATDLTLVSYDDLNISAIDDISVESTNGAIAIATIDGSIDLTSTNGGIGLTTTGSGGISITGHNGVEISSGGTSDISIAVTSNGANIDIIAGSNTGEITLSANSIIIDNASSSSGIKIRNLMTVDASGRRTLVALWLGDHWGIGLEPA